MFDLAGRLFPKHVQQSAVQLGMFPVIGYYPHPYERHGFALLSCGHQVKFSNTADGSFLPDDEFLPCPFCKEPKTFDEVKRRWASEGAVPPRTVIRIEPLAGRKLKGFLECGHVIVGYMSKVRKGRIVRCLQCRGKE